MDPSHSRISQSRFRVLVPLGKMPSAVTFEAVILEAVMKGMMKFAELTAEGEKRNVVRRRDYINTRVDNRDCPRG
jgi:hypothetical protein